MCVDVCVCVCLCVIPLSEAELFQQIGNNKSSQSPAICDERNDERPEDLARCLEPESSFPAVSQCLASNFIKAVC